MALFSPTVLRAQLPRSHQGCNDVMVQCLEGPSCCCTAKEGFHAVHATLTGNAAYGVPIERGCRAEWVLRKATKGEG